MAGISDLITMQNWGLPQPGVEVTPAGVDPFGSTPGAGPAGGGGLFGGLFNGFLNKYNTSGQIQEQGWGMPAIQAASGLMSAYMGMKQYGLYKDQLQESKKQFALNYDAQRQTTNSALEDRQRARVASNAGAYQSVGEYMDQNGIRGR